jgi:hypothetical protein
MQPTLLQPLRIEVDVYIRGGKERLARRRFLDIIPEDGFETRGDVVCDVSTHIKF